MNGALVYTGTTWESYYNGANPANLTGSDLPQRQAMDSVMFHSRGVAVTANDGNGFFFDDVTVDNAAFGATAVPVPAAAWAGLLLLGGMGAMRTVRRRLRRS